MAQLDGVKAVNYPICAGSKLPKYYGDPLPYPTMYRRLVVVLQYVTLTRPNITFRVNQACQFMHAPTTDHWQAVKRILRFLNGTIYDAFFYWFGSFT